MDTLDATRRVQRRWMCDASRLILPAKVGHAEERCADRSGRRRGLVLLTLDHGFSHQQKLEGYHLAVLIVDALSNDPAVWPRCELLQALERPRPGTVIRIGPA